ncbi:FapA family protein [Pelotomaculum isophthalicicum JI]|uniref:FapA family protein n=1 Tax=Pelotomaculum isophthalicicum JI TaxID=947010 RepID=A0A9X4GYQ8_9FIRM|nr:FapA family protein [Pelotomaculum isophthalicicum]MDF9408032.1 FapA family protein [Pelotomaculum isophthalicicum JI]
MESDTGQNNRDKNNLGKVWVKDGKIFVKNPGENGNFPTITPCNGIELLINGIKIEEKTTVSEKDIIELKAVTSEEEEKKGTYQVKLTSGGLSAVLEMKTSIINRQYAQDSDPESNLVLELSSNLEDACPFTLADIMQELAKKNINYGIKHDVIQDILAKPESGQYVIAEGDPPGNTIDEQVELTVKKKSDDEKVKDDDKKVNFRDMVEILSVDPGTLLAVKHPGVQGTPGKKVTGDIIAPAQPIVCELTAGKGAEVSSDGSKVIAKISGSPVMKKIGNKYAIDVDPVLQKKGDVDISSGNIRFKGSVVVQGTVCEGMSVQASEKVDIHGMVFEANITAQGGVNVKQNITGSNLIAGSNKSFYKDFFRMLDPIQSDLSEIAKLVPGLANHPQLKDVKTGQLIQVLIDKKYSRVPNLINELIKFAGENSFSLPHEITELMVDIGRYLRGLNLLKLESLDCLRSILLKMDEAHKLIENMARNKADISFAYAVNSKIEASGDVKVSGRGCINTTIRAGGNVNIAGVFRGGEILANGDVIINEAGSELGAKTVIRTGEKRKVFINKVNEGVRIQIGDRQLNFTSIQNNVKAELDKDGAMSVSTNRRIAK